MGDAMVTELLIALFAGMVLVATFRRNTPRPVELVLWAGLVWVCVLGISNAHTPQARALTSAAHDSPEDVGPRRGVQWQKASVLPLRQRYAADRCRTPQRHLRVAVLAGQRGAHPPGADDRNLRGTAASERRRVGSSGSPSARRIVACSTVDWTQG